MDSHGQYRLDTEGTGVIVAVPCCREQVRVMLLGSIGIGDRGLQSDRRE